MSLKTSDLINQLTSKEFSSLTGELISEQNRDQTPLFRKGSVVEYCENTTFEETYRVYDLDYATIDDLLDLIKWCDFSVYKTTLDELRKERRNVQEECETENALGFYHLIDNQGANWGDIESDIFCQFEPTVEDLKNVLLGMIYHMEIYWEDHGIRFIQNM